MRIADRDLDRYIAKRRAVRVAYSTIRRELVDLKAILNFAQKRRPPLIAFNPVRDYRLPREDLAIIMPPTAGEFAAIVSASPEHLRRIILLVYYLGLRPGPVECYQMRWEHVDWSTETILVTSAKKGGPTKRSVPIHPELVGHLRSWHEADTKRGIPWVVHWGGRPPTRICTAWRLALAAAKISRRIRPYDLRHLMVTQALERGGDVNALSDVVGSSPATLMRHYQHVSTALRRRTAEPAPPTYTFDETDEAGA
jgi:integrase